MNTREVLDDLDREIDAIEDRLERLRAARDAIRALDEPDVSAIVDSGPKPDPAPKPARTSRKTSPPSHPAAGVLPGQVPDQSARLAAENGNPDPGERTQLVLDAIRQSAGGLSKDGIMARTGLSREQVTHQVQKLARDGHVRVEGATRTRRFYATGGGG